MYQNFFIHASIYEQIGCFHVWAIVNSAGTLGYMCLLQLWVSHGIYPVVGLLGHMVAFFFFLISILFFIMAVSIKFPPAVREGCLVSISSPAFIVCRFFLMMVILTGVKWCLTVFWHFSASLVAQMVKNLPAMWETWVQFQGWEDPLEEGMSTHFNTLAWIICLDRGAWQATVHGVAKSWTWLSDCTHVHNNKWNWASFHVFIGHLYVFTGEISV